MSFIKGIAIITIAIAIALIGEATRTYSAFGGEDVLAIILVGFAGYKMMKGEEQC